MTDNEFRTRKMIVLRAIAALQRRLAIKVEASDIYEKYDNITVDFVYTDSINFNPPVDKKITLAFSDKWFNTEEWLTQSKFGDDWTQKNFEDTEAHISSGAAVSEEDKAVLRIAYQFFKYLKPYKEFLK